MAVTSIDLLKQYAGGSEVELPGFLAQEPFVVKLRRPSLLEMAQSGSIPNPLLSAASALFKSGAVRELETGEAFKDLAATLLCVAKAALVEPSFEEMEEAGLTLTDMQLLYIYNFVSSGVDMLKSFRSGEGSAAHPAPGKVTGKKPK